MHVVGTYWMPGSDKGIGSLGSQFGPSATTRFLPCVWRGGGLQGGVSRRTLQCVRPARWGAELWLPEGDLAGLRLSRVSRASREQALGREGGTVALEAPGLSLAPLLCSL